MCNESLIPGKGCPPIEYPYMAHVSLMINHTLILSHRRIYFRLCDMFDN